MEHTPGPWVSEYDNDGNGHFVEWWAIGPKNYPIAKVPIRNSGKEESAANAQLIAAAPDLLEVLQELLADDRGLE